jgi:chromate reductase
MNTMEVYLQTTPDLIDDDGNISNPGTADFLRKYMQEYALFVQRVLTVLPRES